jgi:hypothetical protein
LLIHVLDELVEAGEAAVAASNKALSEAIFTRRIFKFLTKVCEDSTNDPDDGQDERSRSERAHVVLESKFVTISDIRISSDTVGVLDGLVRVVPGSGRDNNDELVESHNEEHKPKHAKDLKEHDPIS